MLTKEERQQRAAERKKEREELAERFPWAFLEGNLADVALIPGELNGLIYVYPDKTRQFHSREAYCMPLGDPRALLLFIEALVARYNWLVEEMKRTSAAIKLADVAPLGDGKIGEDK